MINEMKYDITFDNESEFITFVKFCDNVGLKWECGDKILLKDWYKFKDKICIFYRDDNDFFGLFTCESTTYNVDTIVYISMTFKKFYRCNWKMF